MDAIAPLNLQSCTTTNHSSNSKDSKNLSKGCTTTNTESATVISNDNTLNEQQMYSADGNEGGLVANDLRKELAVIGGSSNNNEHHQSPNQTSRNASPNSLFTNSTNTNSIYEVPSAANLLLLQKNSANVNEDNSPDSNKPDGNSHVTNTMNYKNKTANSTSSSNGSKNSETKNSSTSLNASSAASNSSTNKKSIVSISSYIDAALPAISMQEFLTNLNLSHLIEIFEKEMITIDILAEMGHEELKQIGVQAYGHRHKLLKAVEKLLLHTAAMQQKQNGQSNAPYSMFVDSSLKSQSDVQVRDIKYSQTTLVDLLPNQPEFELVEEEMQSTIREHKDGHAGGKFTR